MKGDRHYPSAWFEEYNTLHQQVLQTLQFAIHRDPQGLECPCSGVNTLGTARPYCPLDNFRQLAATRDVTLGAFAHNSRGDSARVALFAKSIDQIGELFFQEIIHQVSGCLALGTIHSHVERRVPLKAEATLGG